MRTATCTGPMTLAAVLMSVATLQAADVYWTNAEGGDFSVGDNWGGTPPGAEDNARFKTAGTYTVTVDTAAANSMIAVQGPVGGAMDITFDVTAATPWQTTGDSSKWGWDFKLWNDSPTYPVHATLAGGEILIDRAICVGVNRIGGEAHYGNCTLTLTGAGTKMTANRDSIKFGNKGNSVIEVLNGAALKSAASGLSVAGDDNVFRVKGAGSTYTESGTFALSGRRNKMEIADGAVWSKTSTFQFGWDGSSDNVAEISGGATFLFSGNNDVAIGKNGTNNVIRVTGDGSLMDVSAAVVKVGPQPGAVSNRLEILDGAICSNAPSAWIGANATAVGNGMLVSNATYVSGKTSALYVNAAGQGNWLKVCDGGVMTVDYHLNLGGKDSAASDGLVEVSGAGSVLQVTRYDLNVGTKGPRNVLYAHDGAAVLCTRETYVGSNSGTTVDTASENVLRIYNAAYSNFNANTSLKVFNQGRVSFGGSRFGWKVANRLQVNGESTLEFVFDEDGINTLDVQELYFRNTTTGKTDGKLVIDTTKFVQNAASSVQNTFKIVNGVYATNFGDLTAEEFARDRVTVLPEGVKYKLDVGRNTITISDVHLPKGLMIIFR